ncbi:Ionotropic glutamate receptor plant protein, partial [Dioscorea alata]
MEMAIGDINNLTNQGLVLHAMDSHGDPLQAASAAMTLINEHHAKALIGLATWQEASFVAELGTRAQVPVLSFIGTYPPAATRRCPFLVPLAHSQVLQMKAIAAIIQSWSWKKVSLIYEDVEYTATTIIPYLADALGDANIYSRVALSSYESSFSEELEMLRCSQSRVFVVHTSIQLATRLFAEAYKKGMMTDGYVWITTDAITSKLDHVNSSVISSMQGVLGVKNYFKPSAQTSDFIKRFQRRYHSEYPKEKRRQPQVSSFTAYDTIWAIAKAMNKTNVSEELKKVQNNSVNGPLFVEISKEGWSLLDGIKQSNFTGLNGEFIFKDGKFSLVNAFQIVNVVGKSYRELGFWLLDCGFSKNLESKEGNETSMKNLGQVYWPEGPWSVPKGWVSPTCNKSLIVAVPAKAVFPEFVTVKKGSDNKTLAEGFSINVFKKVLEQLSYPLPNDFIPFNISYDEFSRRQTNKNYDILVGDTSISSGRYNFVEFSQPYTASGLVMVVPVKSDVTSKAWIFLKPFRGSMWALTAIVSIYNGMVVWMIERSCNMDFRGSFWNQSAALFWLSFTTLLSPGEKLHSNLSRLAMVVWLFAALVLTSNYTATLSSMLTVHRLEPNLVNVDSLKGSNAVVGCNNGSVVSKYLQTVLGFQQKNIKLFSSGDEYYQALKNGTIQAAFLRTPYANLLLSKYCSELISNGPIFHVGGLGFVFPKDSPLLSSFSEAILKIFENGELEELEKAMRANYSCSSVGVNATDVDGLSPENFWGLFFVTVGISTIALVVYGLCHH